MCLCVCFCVCVFGMDFDCVWLEKKNSLHVRRGFTDTKTENPLQTYIGGNPGALYCPLVARNSWLIVNVAWAVFSFSNDRCLLVLILGKSSAMSSMSLDTRQRVRARFVSLICYIYVSQSHAQKSDAAESKMKMYGMMTSSWFPGVLWEKSRSFKSPRLTPYLKNKKKNPPHPH